MRFSLTSREFSVEPLLKEKKLSLVEADIRDKEALERVFEEFKFDKLIHLAAQAGVRFSLKEPSLYMDININGT